MRTVLTTLAVLGVPRLALSCPVCFGQSDSPLAQAINAGVLAMLVVVAGTLGGFATFIVYLARRARAIDVAGETVAATAAHVGSDPKEGIVRC